MFGRSTILCCKNMASFAAKQHHCLLAALSTQQQHYLSTSIVYMAQPATATVASTAPATVAAVHKSPENAQMESNNVMPASTATAAPYANPSGYISKEEIEELLHRHSVKGVSMPVRREFISKTPLKTQDLQAIDIHVYHRKPETFSDHVASGQSSCYASLQMPSGVPGMVAGMFCHLKSLRRMQNDNGWIEKLLHEAENERMHLMIWMKVTKPTLMERILVTLAQGAFFNFYAFFYLAFPRTAHRMVGYLEEEAIVSYNGFAKEIHQGHIDNSPAPK
uniref:Alternative oxidase n=1 Tax=Ditylenchus dipsaci TaxID=166011 RepID=A0A915DD92_9BILA